MLFQMEFTEPASDRDFRELVAQADFDVNKEVANLQALLAKDPEIHRFAKNLVDGVTAHREDLDRWIQDHSANWRMNRMSNIDRNILRIAVFELRLGKDESEPSIVINEAVEIAKRFGGTQSAGFVNGVLDAIAKDTSR